MIQEDELRTDLTQKYWVQKLRNVNNRFFKLIHPIKMGRFSAVTEILNVQASSFLGKLTKNNPVAEFTVFLAIFRLVLNKHYPKYKVLISSPGFNSNGIESYMYYDINFKIGETLRHLIETSRNEVLDSLKYGHYNEKSLYNELGKYGITKELLYVFCLDHTNINSKPKISKNCCLQLLVKHQDDGQFRFEFIYNELQFDKLGIELLADLYRKLCQSLSSNLECFVTNIQLLTDKEIKLLNDFNDTKKIYPKNQSVLDLFETQVLKSAHSPALYFRDRSYSYQELGSLVNRFSNFIINRSSLKSKFPVAMIMERSEQCVIAMIAIMKAGCYFVPIDIHLPLKRIQFIFADVKPVLVLIDEGFPYKKEFESNNLISIESLCLSNFSELKPKVSISPEDLAFIIYTSGSTGRPKGVMQSHRTLYNLIQWNLNYSGINKSSRVLQYAAFSFDASIHDVYCALCGGGSLFIYPQENRLNSTYIRDVIIRNKIQLLSLPFSVLKYFFEQMEFNELVGHSITDIVSTGEQLYIDSNIRSFLKTNPGVKLHNFYGPTETHVVTNFTLKGSDKTIPTRCPIGKPISNSQIYILDKELNLAPIMVEGDIYIAGENLATGYLNNEGLTAQRFIEYTVGNETKKLYKSGDLGKWLYNGNIEFIGREDDQVKIRGNRVELSEIVNNLRGHRYIKDVVALVKKINEEDQLIVYYNSEKKIEYSILREFLAKSLPEYMVPAFIVWLPKFPLNTNGKIDNTQLPDPLTLNVIGKHDAPTNDLERRLVEIWKEIIGVTDIGINQSFLELGGESLKVARLQYRIKKEFMIDVPLSSIFQYPTIKDLSMLISQMENVEIEYIKPNEEQYYYKLSNSQKRVWLLEQRGNKSSPFNLLNSYLLKGKVSVSVFRKTLEVLFKRHESLRTVFTQIQGEPAQLVKPFEKLEFKFQVFNYQKYVDKIERVHRYVKRESLRRFKLEKGPLLRATLFQIDKEEFIFFICMHHIISDAWSIAVFVKDFSKVYRSLLSGKYISLKPLRIQYKDYAAWHNTAISKPEIARQIEYWEKEFVGYNASHNRLNNKPLPEKKGFLGASLSLSLSDSIHSKLESLSKRYSATVFSALLSNLLVLIYSYTGKSEAVIGVPTSGRNHIDFENQIGIYLNVLPIRLRFKETDDFASIFKNVKTKIQEALDNQLFPFDAIVRELKGKYEMNRNPLFDIGFNYYGDSNFTTSGINRFFKNFELSNFETGFSSVTCDIWINAFRTFEGIDFRFDFDVDLFDESFRNDFVSGYNTLLKEVTNNPKILLTHADSMIKGNRELFLENRLKNIFSRSYNTFKTFIEKI